MAYRRHLILAAFIIGSAVGMVAQTGAASGGAEGTATRRVTIVGVVNPDADYTGLVLAGGSQPVPVAITPGARSAQVVLPKGAKDLVLAKQGTDPKTGKPGYVPVLTVAWPGEKAREALLIIGQSAVGKELKGIAMDDGRAAFPMETTIVVNLTGVLIQAKVDRFAGELKPGQPSVPIAYPDTKKLPPNSVARYPMALAVKSPEGEFIRLSTGYMEAAPGTRSLVLIQSPLEAGSKKIRIKTLVDRMAAAPAAPVAR